MSTLSKTENGAKKRRPKSGKRKSIARSAGPTKKGRPASKSTESNRPEAVCLNSEAAGEDRYIFDNVLGDDRPVSEEPNTDMDIGLIAGQDLSVEEEILRSLSSEQVDVDTRQLVCFRLDDQEYGVDIHDVREINRSLQMTRIPDTPIYIEGMVNLRGKVIPVLNLRLLLGFPDQKDDRHTRVIVLEGDDRQTLLGIKVDAVTVVLRVARNQIDPVPDQTTSGKESFLESIYHRDHTLVLIIDSRKIISMKAACDGGTVSAGDESGDK